MRMSIVINDRLMNEALDASGRAKKQETVEEALKLRITHRHHTQIKNFSGNIRLEGKLRKVRAYIREKRDRYSHA
jgi:hypothetical protein